MKHYLKILSFILITGSVIFGNAQVEYCPEMQLLLQKFKQKDYAGSKLYLDTVIKKCPDRKLDAYYWHISGFVHMNVFKNIDNKSPISKSREIAVESFLKSKKTRFKSKICGKHFKSFKVFK
jgi:hypothetical protein